MDAVPLLQMVSAFVLNLGFTWLVGAWCARRWIAGDAAPRYLPVLRRWDLAAAGLVMAASVLSLWAATAVMGGTGLGDATPMVWMMLTSTAYGHAGTISMLALVLLFGWRAAVAGNAASDIVPAAAMLIFAVARASMGHAGENGWISATMLAESVHYVGIGVWTGVVAVSGWLVLRVRGAAALAGHSASRYLDSMSLAATVALAAIIASGVYSAWHRVGATEHLLHTTYGLTLLLKIGLVLLAIALGGYNKLIGLPWASRSARGLLMVRRVLQAETVVLIGVLAAAALLTSLQPPAAM